MKLRHYDGFAVLLVIFLFLSAMAAQGQAVGSSVQPVTARPTRCLTTRSTPASHRCAARPACLAPQLPWRLENVRCRTSPLTCRMWLRWALWRVSTARKSLLREGILAADATRSTATFIGNSRAAANNRW